MSRRYPLDNEPKNISPDLAALIDEPVRLISFGQYIENHKKQHKNCQCVINNCLYETKYTRSERHIFDSTNNPSNLISRYDSNSEQNSIKLITRELLCSKYEKEEVKKKNSNINTKQQVRHGRKTDDGSDKENVNSKKVSVEKTNDNVVPNEKVSSSQANNTKNFGDISYQTEFYNKICNTVECATHKSEEFPTKNNRKSRSKRSLSQSSRVEKSNNKKKSQKVMPQSKNLEVVIKSNTKSDNKNVVKSNKKHCSTDNIINTVFGYPNNNRKNEGMSVSNSVKSKNISKPNEINSKYHLNSGMTIRKPTCIVQNDQKLKYKFKIIHRDPETDVKYSNVERKGKIIKSDLNISKVEKERQHSQSLNSNKKIQKIVCKSVICKCNEKKCGNVSQNVVNTVNCDIQTVNSDVQTPVNTVDCDVQTVENTTYYAAQTVANCASVNSQTESILSLEVAMQTMNSKTVGTSTTTIRTVSMDVFIGELLPLYICYYQQLMGLRNMPTRELIRISSKVSCIMKAQQLLMSQLSETLDDITSLINTLEVENFNFFKLLAELNLGCPMDIKTYSEILFVIFPADRLKSNFCKIIFVHLYELSHLWRNGNLELFYYVMKELAEGRYPIWINGVSVDKTNLLQQHTISCQHSSIPTNVAANLTFSQNVS